MRWLVIPLVFALSACTATPTPVPVSHERLSFTGFQSQGSNPAIMDASATAMTVLAIDGVNFVPSSGSLVLQRQGVSAVEPSALELLKHAHEKGVRAELMVGNFDNELGDFSGDLAAEALTSSGRRIAVDEVVELVEQQGWDGVNIDIEAIDGDEAGGVTLFARELKSALGPAKTVSIAIPLKSSPEDYADAGFDLESLTQHVDRFIVMAYDEHGPWEDIPGPVGSLDWQRVGIQALLEAVEPEKIELGVAGYGYAWGPSAPDGQLSVGQARELAPDATFDAAAGEWTATLADGTELWFSDIQSFELRVDLAQDYELKGVALWSLEQGDAITQNDLK